MASVRAFTSTGQQIPGKQILASIVWTGATTAADTCQIKEIGGDIIWEGRANSTNTYIGITLTDQGLSSLKGFEVQQISSGTVFLYTKEF
jgi:hypothetical protein